MARSRVIKHDFWTSEDIIELDIVTRLFFIGFWNFADDSGVLPDKPKKLKCMIFPADNIDCSVLVDSLVSCGLLVRYMCGTSSYLRVANWPKHQTIKYPTYQYPIENGSIPQSSRRKKEPKKEDIDTDIGIGVEEGIPGHVEDMSGTCDTHKQISENLQGIIFSAFGGPASTNVMNWVDRHEEAWIIKAIARAEASKKCNIPYVNAILDGWAREGYPEENKDGRGNARDTVTVNAGESESEGPCPYEARVRHIEDLPDTGQDPF